MSPPASPASSMLLEQHSSCSPDPLRCVPSTPGAIIAMDRSLRLAHIRPSFLQTVHKIHRSIKEFGLKYDFWYAAQICLTLFGMKLRDTQNWRRNGWFCRMLPFPLRVIELRLGHKAFGMGKFRACAHRNYELAYWKNYDLFDGQW